MLGRKATPALADRIVDEVRRLPVRRESHHELLPRCWEVRDDLTPHDAAYVALAELWDMPLLTTDARLARATGPRCEIEVVGVSPR